MARERKRIVVRRLRLIAVDVSWKYGARTENAPGGAWRVSFRCGRAKRVLSCCCASAGWNLHGFGGRWGGFDVWCLVLWYWLVLFGHDLAPVIRASLIICQEPLEQFAALDQAQETPCITAITVPICFSACLLDACLPHSHLEYSLERGSPGCTLTIVGTPNVILKT